MDLGAVLKAARAEIEPGFRRYLGEEEGLLAQAMAYSLYAGGKRLRPILALLSYRAAGGKSFEEIMPAAAALEFVHTFTLIHDDLPSMDDDDFRRGKPSSHKKFTEAMAILAGDALMIDGLGLMACSAAKPELVRRAVAEFSRILGREGVTRGQAEDLYGREVNPRFLRHVHLRKTALFISFSIWVGALLAGEIAESLDCLSRAGVLAGMGFQVRDDVLDVVSSRKELGKTPGKDEKAQKLTYPHIYGVQRSQRIAQGYSHRAAKMFNQAGKKYQILAELTRYLVERTR